MKQKQDASMSSTNDAAGILVQDDIAVTIRPATPFYRRGILFAIALFGYLGTILAFFSMFTPVYNKKLLIFAGAIAFLAYSAMSMLPKKFRWLPPLSIAAFAGICFVKRNLIFTGFQFFYNHLYQNIYDTEVLYYRMDTALDETTCTTFFLIVCLVFLSCLICWFTIHHPFFLIGFLITFLPIELGLYNGLEMTLLSAAFLLIYWTALLVMQLTTLRYTQSQQEIGFFRKGNTFAAAYTPRTTMAERCGMVMACLTALVFALSWGFLTASGVTEKKEVTEKREELKDSLESFDVDNVQDSLANIVGKSMQVQKLGKKSYVDIQNEPQLTLTLDRLPDHAFYLKSFTGTTYEDNAWTVLDDDTWEDNESLSTLSEVFNCYPQLFPYWFHCNRSADAVTQISVAALKWERRCYVPYAAYQESATYSADYGVTMSSKKNYTFSVSTDQDFSTLLRNHTLETIFLSKSMFNTNDTVTNQFLEALSLPDDTSDIAVTTYISSNNADGSTDQHAIQAMLTEQYIYRPFVYEQYTTAETSDALQAVYDILPTSIQNAQLDAGITEESLIAGGGESLEDQLTVLEEIRQFLAEQATYSTSPGRTPSSRDFVNYFLLENQQGYCTHFATAGVLLARYAGIPARYCEGYVVTPTNLSSATENDDGEYEMELTDANAHAWCEFYVTGYGWIPFEFTPGYYGAAEESAEPVTTTTTTQTSYITTERTTQQTITQTKAAAVTEQTTATQTDTAGRNGASDQNRSHTVLKIILRIFLVLLLLAAICATPILLRRYACQKRERLFHSPDRANAVLAMYCYWERLLAFVGIFPDNQPILTFSRMAAQQLKEKQLPADHTETFCLLVSAVDLGKKEPSEEERTMALQMLQELAHAIEQQSTTLQKLIMQYLKHLI